MVFLDEDEAVAIDWKSGKQAGNEIKHMDQMKWYQLGAFFRYPALERVHVELHYTDVGESTPATFTREQGMRFFERTNRRIRKMLDDRVFAPTPSLNNCRFCPYKTGKLGRRGPQGTGHCDLNPE